MTRAGIVAATLLAAACTADVLEPVPDTGPGPIDAAVTPDSGISDGGGPAPDCPYGTEGCDCANGLAVAPFTQADCEDGLRCVPWRNQRTAPNSTAYFRRPDSCVRLCEIDSECAPDQLCRGIGMLVGGVEMTGCVDEVAGEDEWCGFSRRAASYSPTVTLRVPGTIRGCEPDTVCVHVSGLHADEGACVTRCDSDDDCSASSPYCNPVDPERGICSLRQNGAGAACGSIDPSKAGLNNRCDASDATPELLCLETAGLQSSFGHCTSLCNEDGTCEGEEAGIGPYECFNEIFCSVPCSLAPNNCEGEGNGLGRMCDDFTLGNILYNTCVDRIGPPLRPASVSAAGFIRDAGETCFNDFFSEDPALAVRSLRCPDPTTCLLLFSDAPDPIGMCVDFCDPTIPETGDLYCQQSMSSTTAVCVVPFGDANAFCGDGP